MEQSEATRRAMEKKAKKRRHVASASRKPKLKIGFILTPRFTLTSFAGFIDAIRLAADEGDQSRQLDCQWSVLGNSDELIASSCGLLVKPWDTMTDPKRFDYIVVAGGLLHGGQKVLPGTYTFLRAAAKAGVPLVGLCTASFIFARAGLLEGYVACVSWFHRDEFENEFPHVQVQSNRMFIIDRDRITSAGGASTVHLAAHLIEKHCGRAQALKSLRILIEEQPLPSNAWQPEAIITRQAQDSLVRQAMLIIEQNLSEAESLSKLAEALQISVRQIERRFISDVGISPAEYRLRLRLSRAKWLVEHTDRSMTEIGIECGFSDGSHFCRTFKNRFSTRPTEARRRAHS